MIKLDIKTILKNARKYIKNGKLGAQKHSMCKYSYEDGCKCIIGCGINEKISTYDNVQNVRTLINARLLEVEPLELQDICQLQKLHDNWARCFGAEEKKRNRSSFYKFLHSLYKKYGV